MSQEEREPEEGERVPFLAHLEELRNRLIKAFLAVIVGFFACYGFSDRLFSFVSQPIRDALDKAGGHMQILHPMEGFVTDLKVAFVGGLVIALPVILYQLWRFVAPGLYAHEKRYVWPFVAGATVFFLAGAAFAYYMVFPVAFPILFGYAGKGVLPMPSKESALELPLKLLLSFGLIFELPVVTFFLAKMGLVHYKLLSKNRGYSVIGILVVAAFLTPTGDPFNQLLMALPLYLLFELSIVIARVFGPTPPQEEKEAEDVDEEPPAPPSVTE
ncbi:MAG: twin-arginine translocase subunit TatC [Deltaproteobacteria bacterium]|nr:twin-arginine translocase subunit TatC [Deltaproteobacteria bacterium]